MPTLVGYLVPSFTAFFVAGVIWPGHVLLGVVGHGLLAVQFSDCPGVVAMGGD